MQREPGRGGSPCPQPMAEARDRAVKLESTRFRHQEPSVTTSPRRATQLLFDDIVPSDP